MPPESLNSDAFFNKLRKKEYSTLDKLGHVYLDYTGGNIHPRCLLDKHYRYLKEAVFGNPHSTNPVSKLSEKLIDEARQKVLDFFNAQDYYCVFTQNASGALQIVGECYPFSRDSHLLLTVDNHNSVNGIREYCRNKGGSYSYSPMNCEDLTINYEELKKRLSENRDRKDKLFAYPAQSNVSGVQHCLSLIKLAQDKDWDVLLDAAAFVPTSKLDLASARPDFVSLSFYKMFGYPTGIGCLLIRKARFHKLQKPWFAGGTLSVASVRFNGYFLKQGHEKFENGTVNYLDIPAVSNGLDYINSISMANISCRIRELCGLFLQKLQSLVHSNGLPLVKLYGPKHTANRGGTFLMNFFDMQGNAYPYYFIEQLANADGISIRTGCFCNPGIDELNNNISEDQLRQYFATRGNGDAVDMIQYLSKSRGAVRVSFGLPTTTVDIGRFILFAKKLLNTTVPVEVGLAYGE
jgi:selenocysteine lyase/cysteine desulfurase